MNKLILSQISGLLIVISFFSYAQNFDTAVVDAVPFAEQIKRTGKLDFKRTLNMSFKSSGYLEKLKIDEGEYFKKGQLLASLDTAELVENKNSTYAQLMQAKRDVTRIRKLLEQKSSSERDLEEALTSVETTRASYQVAYYNLEKAQVIAPFDGVVLSRHTELGELLSPGKEILKVAAIENNWIIRVVLTGSEVGNVRLGQKVSVELQHVGRIEGVISKIPAIANTDGHLFMIEVLLPELKLTSGIIAGQLAEVTIRFASEDFVYQIPIQALMGVDSEGRALLMTQITNAVQNKSQVVEQSFDIYKLDNNFVYVSTQADAQALQVVTQGWQNITTTR